MRKPVACLLLVVCCIPGALAWGVKGHTWTCENAVKLLPEGSLRQYMRAQSDSIQFNSLVPDFQWKDGKMADLEAPNHYIDLEVISATPTAADLPRTRSEAMALYNARGIAFSNGGFLPWRIEEGYLMLVNAFRTSRRDVPFYAGVLAHYAADATMPLHTTVHYNGRTDRRVEGRKFLYGIHSDYEIVFLEDHGFEFRESSLKLARPSERLESVYHGAVETILRSFGKVDQIYAAAEAHQGPDRYEAWEREIGPMTREQLADAASFIASLWLTAWDEAGCPEMAE